MNPKHYYTPPSTRARCPVCHESVYSKAGIHPQCAVRQADSARPKGKPPGTPGTDEPVIDPLPAGETPAAATIPVPL